MNKTPIIMMKHKELRIVYPSGKILFFKMDSQEQDNYEYYLIAEEDLKASGYEKLSVKVKN